jgi:hypothetical protein
MLFLQCSQVRKISIFLYNQAIIEFIASRDNFPA